MKKINFTHVFVVTSYKNYHDLFKLLDSLASASWFSNSKVIIVDNNSGEDFYKKVIHFLGRNSLFSNVNFFQLDRNYGYAYAEHFGIEKAINDNADFIHSINSDIEFNSKELDHIPTEIEKFYQKYGLKNKCALITPVIFDSNSNFQNPLKRSPPNLIQKIIIKFITTKTIEKIYLYLRMNPFLFSFFSMLGRFRYNISSKNSFDFHLKTKAPNNHEQIYAAHGAYIVLTPLYFDQDILPPETFMYCEELIRAEELISRGLSTFLIYNFSIYHKSSSTVNFNYQDERKKIFFLITNMMKSCRIYAKILKLKKR